jgi:hypothetical protein
MSLSIVFLWQLLVCFNAKDGCKNTIVNDDDLICLGSLGSTATNVIILLCSCLAQGAKASSATVTADYDFCGNFLASVNEALVL